MKTTDTPETLRINTSYEAWDREIGLNGMPEHHFHAILADAIKLLDRDFMMVFARREKFANCGQPLIDISQTSQTEAQDIITLLFRIYVSWHRKIYPKQF